MPRRGGSAPDSAAAKMPDSSIREAGCVTCNVVPLHDHAGYAFPRQVVGGDNACHAASDYYDVRSFRRHLIDSQLVLA